MSFCASLSHDLGRWDISVSSDVGPCLSSVLERFEAFLAQDANGEGDKRRISSNFSLACAFLSFLLDDKDCDRILRVILPLFERDFLSGTDIHFLLKDLDTSEQVSIKRTYYGAVAKSGSRHLGRQSTLFRSIQDGHTTAGAIFGGQGTTNSSCLRELRELYVAYNTIIGSLLDATIPTITTLSALPYTEHYYEDFGFDLELWLREPESEPPQSYIASAPISFPLIGLLSLTNYYLICKILGKSPGEMRSALRGVTGHSQGIIIAVAVAQSDSWESFFKSARSAMELLFWIGFESHHSFPSAKISAAVSRNHEEAGEGQPSSMLSIRGLNLNAIGQLIQEQNQHLNENNKIYVGLVNSRDNIVVAGPPNALSGLALRIRHMKSDITIDQSRLPFNRRKPHVFVQFLPVSAAFHTPYLESISSRILSFLTSKPLVSSDLGISLYHTQTGEDLRYSEDPDLRESVIRMITCEKVDWPKVCSKLNVSHLLDFGPGHIGSLVHDISDGAGLRVIMASVFDTSSRDVGPMTDLFSSEPLKIPMNWAETYRPRLRKALDGSLCLDTKMSRLLGVPPIMVAGMTPTTVPWDFVAAIMNSGYHVELAGGGYMKPKDFEMAIRSLAASVPVGRGITCNLIYVNPKAMSWQIAVIKSLLRAGFQIDGLTIGAGIPSPDVAKDYIETIGIKHIWFKPGSYEAILEVIAIAKSHPDFPIGLQWTGGRAGGHHSFEDFHLPILRAYGRIRRCPNIILIAGSGFGGAPDTYPYISGTWSEALDYPAMPFDGVLLGSRMMVAKEAHTSLGAKILITQAQGTADSQWHKSYDEPVGGIITVKSEMGQPIHKLATRGVMLWNDLDRRIFSIKDPVKRLHELQLIRPEVVSRLNSDFAKPWFARTSSGEVTDIETMTYADILRRLIELMYIRKQKRWIDPSYRTLMLDFLARAQERLVACFDFNSEDIVDPSEMLATFSRCYPASETEYIYPEDVTFFIALCKRRGQKPVNFIPILDANFETWFKKDSLWQSENLDAVLDEDAQRVCIIQGPVAAAHSKLVDEPAKSILDNISAAHVEMVKADFYTDKSHNFQTADVESPVCQSPLINVTVDKFPLMTRYKLGTTGPMPNTDLWADHLASLGTGWVQACFRRTQIRRGLQVLPNPILSALKLHPSDTITVVYRSSAEVESISLKSNFGRSHGASEVFNISSMDGKHVTVLLIAQSKDLQIRKVPFYFTYRPEVRDCGLVEDAEGRNERIKSFYADLWTGGLTNDLKISAVDAEFTGKQCQLTRQVVNDFIRVIARSDVVRGGVDSSNSVVPIDICIAMAWDSLVKPLMIPLLDGDLLKLLHRSNSFEYYPGVTPLKINDIINSTSRISGITIQPPGKLVEIVATIKRDGQSVVKITSAFLIQGDYSDHSGTFQSRNYEFEVVVDSEKLNALLLSRRWLAFNSSIKNMLGWKLKFKIINRTGYSADPAIMDLQISGQIFSDRENESRCIVGEVHFERSGCHGNPVLEFMNRHASPSSSPKALSSPGWNDPQVFRIRIPKQNGPYSSVSGDYNPIHTSPIFAGYVNLPGTVTHGMFTSAVVRRAVEKEVAAADTSRFRRYSVSFEGMVLPNDTLRVQIQHTAMVEGRMVLQIQAFNDATDEKVLEGSAEVDQAPTTYLFCGQGCQEKGMGMALYDTSPASKAMWDKGSDYLLHRYGFSLLDIVRNDPKSLTVHFGGRRGRQIRENYLAMKHKVLLPSGEEVEKPVIAGLTAQSSSYTFRDERGLLFSTQFAQPALMLMEIAELEHLKSKGLVQQNAPFAGHSLGEYSALGALTTFMPIEDLLNLVFYRGLHMQNAMKRDQDGHTDFSMVAVNPSRVGKDFNQSSLENIVELVSVESGVLLEIVNYNVEKQQYVCAGHLRALWLLGKLCDRLASITSASKLSSEDIIQEIRELLSLSNDLPRHIKLFRGTATIPLSGIDVPFHSTYLRGGIDTYRNFLKSKILEENIHPEELVGRWIPNITGVPFSVKTSYIQHVADITGSKILRMMLDEM